MEIHKNRIYRHFKGDYYLVVDTALNNENDEIYVIYQALYGNGTLFIRSFKDFLSPVDKIKYPNTTQEYKFELQEIMSVNKTHNKTN